MVTTQSQAKQNRPQNNSDDDTSLDDPPLGDGFCSWCGQYIEWQNGEYTTTCDNREMNNIWAGHAAEDKDEEVEDY